MCTRTVSRVLVSAAFLVWVMLGVNATAQLAARPSTGSTSRQIPPSKGSQNHAAIEQNAGCQRIVNECKNLGFIQGQWKEDNGLWRDCFNPVVKGGSPTRDGKPINVPVSPSDVQACRAAESHHRKP